MKILIINPNSDLEMTEAIQRTAENFSGGDFEVTCKPTPGAPKFIETYEDEIKTAPGMIQLVRENEDKFDAFIIACHDDPNLDVMKEISLEIPSKAIHIDDVRFEEFDVVITLCIQLEENCPC